MLKSKEVENAKPKAKTYRLFDDGGLYLEVAPNGGRYWRMKYSFDRRERRIAFGKYPEVAIVEAREKRDIARKKIMNGEDPGEEVKIRKQLSALRAAKTFEAVALEWHENFNERWAQKYVLEILSKLERDIFPKFGSRQIDQITSPEVLVAIRGIEKRGAFEVARRTLSICNQIFRYAVVTGRIRYNPAADMHTALRPTRRTHFHAFDYKEIPNFVQTLNRNASRLFPQTRYAIQLMMLTFVRTGELLGARWEEIDLEKAEWVIPPERMKMRRPHIIPLANRRGSVSWTGWRINRIWRPYGQNGCFRSFEKRITEI